MIKGPNDTFLGWATSPNATEPEYTEDFIPTSDMTLYAVWKSEGGVSICIDGEFVSAIPYIYTNNEWVQAVPHVYTDGEWKASTGV
jgi:hypothetical protein